MTFTTKAIGFYAGLLLDAPLPQGVEILHPYQQPSTMRCVESFYQKFYNNTADNTPEPVGIFGVNPGRFGGGLTGISFTDPVALRQYCGIENELGTKKELSSEYVYMCIEAFGGVQSFFANFYLSALCPLGFVKDGINYNFYDDPQLQTAVLPFMVDCMNTQLSFPLRRKAAICFGTGKLKTVFDTLNGKHSFFEKIHYLEHPRFIMQYRRKRLGEYVQKYVDTFQAALA